MDSESIVKAFITIPFTRYLIECLKTIQYNSKKLKKHEENNLCFEYQRVLIRN